MTSHIRQTGSTSHMPELIVLTPPLSAYFIPPTKVVKLPPSALKSYLEYMSFIYPPTRSLLCVINSSVLNVQRLPAIPLEEILFHLAQITPPPVVRACPFLVLPKSSPERPEVGDVFFWILGMDYSLLIVSFTTHARPELP